MDLHLVGPGDVPAQLKTLYNDMASFCKSAKIPLHADTLTRTLVGFAKDSDFPVGQLCDIYSLCISLVR